MERKWCITSWQPLVAARLDLLDYLIYQAEYTASDKIHYQGYVEFKRPYTQAIVKRFFKQKQMHLEPARENRSANIMYCTKSRTYAGVRYCFDGQHVRYEDKRIAMSDLEDELDDVFDIKRENHDGQ